MAECLMQRINNCSGVKEINESSLLGSKFKAHTHRHIYTGFSRVKSLIQC